MGIIADFIIANELEALEYSRTQSGIPSSNMIEAKGITIVELSTLMALLDGKDWHQDLLDVFPLIRDESSVLSKIGEPLLSRLTDFDYDIDQVAADWAATEEMQWEVDEAQSLIDELAQLAVKAKSVGKSVYLWNCV
jgi:hypothetical protein